MARGAPLGVVDDDSALNAAEIRVGARIGWLLRMTRQSAPGGPPPLETMASRLDTSPAQLHRLETGQLRDGRLVDGYEQVLQRPEGSLRAPIDIVCRTFPTSPGDRDPGVLATSVDDMSALTDAVSAAQVDGGTWLRWARSISQPGAIGLPSRLAAELVDRLVSELGRAVGVGYPSRYEALALLRCGPYGEVVLDAARRAAGDPHVQVLFDLMSAVGEAASPDAVAWCLELLGADNPRLIVGGALALENMDLVARDPAFWRPLVDPLIERFNAAEPGSDRWRWLSHVLRLPPRSELARATVEPRQRPAPPARIEDWSRTRLNGHWTDCERRAGVITDGVGLPAQPMLARLLFDIAISPFESRAVTSYMLLGALPTLVAPVAEALADLAAHHPDPVVRDRVGRRLAGTMHGVLPPAVRAWLQSNDPTRRDRALMLAGASGTGIPEDVLRAAVADGPASRHAALYAAGMAGASLVSELTAHPDEELAGGARWWERHGARVLDG